MTDYWHNNTYEDGVSQALADAGRDTPSEDLSLKSYAFQTGYHDMARRIRESGLWNETD